MRKMLRAYLRKRRMIAAAVRPQNFRGEDEERDGMSGTKFIQGGIDPVAYQELVEATPAAATIKGNGRPVIVRSRDAGVQFGYLEEYSPTGATITVRNARQMWSWTAAKGGTLLDCATHGVKAGKFSTVSERVIVLNACAIIDCTPEAVKSLESASWE